MYESKPSQRTVKKSLVLDPIYYKVYPWTSILKSPHETLNKMHWIRPKGFYALIKCIFKDNYWEIGRSIGINLLFV